jgi:hypothetical protein
VARDVPRLARDAAVAQDSFPPFTTWTTVEGKSIYMPCVMVSSIRLIACASEPPQGFDTANPSTGTTATSELASAGCGPLFGCSLAYGQSGVDLYADWDGLLGLPTSTKTPVKATITYTGIPFTLGVAVGSCSRSDVYEATVVGSSIGVTEEDWQPSSCLLDFSTQLPIPEIQAVAGLVSLGQDDINAALALASASGQGACGAVSSALSLGQFAKDLYGLVANLKLPVLPNLSTGCVTHTFEWKSNGGIPGGTSVEFQVEPIVDARVIGGVALNSLTGIVNVCVQAGSEQPSCATIPTPTPTAPSTSGGSGGTSPLSSGPWSGPIAVDAADIDSLACPSESQCTAVDQNGSEVTFNPGSPGSVTPVPIDGSNFLATVACPSVSQCTTVDADGREVTFDPNNPTDRTEADIDSLGRPYGPRALACPSISQCTMTDSGGNEETFDPAHANTAKPVYIDPGFDDTLTSVACPVESQCTAIYTFVYGGGGAVTFNPTDCTSTKCETNNYLDDDENNPHDIACPSESQCTIVDGDGDEVTFDPNGTGTPPSFSTIDNTNALNSISCPTASLCVAVDGIGNAVEGAPTNPLSFSVAPIPGSNENSFNEVVCSSASHCVAQYEGVVFVRPPISPG